MARLGLPRRAAAESHTRSWDMRGLRFDPLPGTRVEVEAVADLLGKGNAVLYTGREALEEALRARERPRILHLATHGFFLSDQELPRGESSDRGQVISLTAAKGKTAQGEAGKGGNQDSPDGSSGKESAKTGPTPGDGKGALAKTGQPGSADAASNPPAAAKQNRYENPLLRSGIALAGANRAVAAGVLTESDGIVTAEKILGLRLQGTEMVVLSACETSLGEVKSGEGVFGLRRVFTQAGAQSLVMSMWSVPDRETQELMTAFYGNLLSGKMSRSQALRAAVRQQKQTVQGRYGWANPFFWAAFVFLGEP